MSRVELVLAAGVLLCSAVAPARADPRIRQLRYDPQHVVELRFCVGFETTVRFGPGERIENVAVGDSAHWESVTNKSADALFIKPVAATAHSNLTVLTSKRIYNFELRARPDGCPGAQTAFSLSFRYPHEDKPAAPVPPQHAGAAVAVKTPSPAGAAPHNARYSYKGDGDLVPFRVYDDGHATYFRWPEGVPTPAVYAVDQSGNKSLVNFHVKDGAFVVDLVEPEFELRRGDSVCHLFNDGFKPPVRDAASPQPREETGDRLLAFLGLG